MLDTGQNAIHIWVGMNCTKNLKKSAMSIALVRVWFLLNFWGSKEHLVCHTKSMNRNFTCV